jgi:hypothetical protein
MSSKPSPPGRANRRRSASNGLSRSMASVRARCDMDEVAGLDRLESVPDATRHDVRVAGPQEHCRLGAHCTLVTVIEDQFHRSAHDIEELVTVRMHLTTMRTGSLDVGDRADGVPIDAPRRSRRSRCDGHRPVATDVGHAPFEVDGRRFRGSCHPPRLPDACADGQRCSPGRRIEALGHAARGPHATPQRAAGSPRSPAAPQRRGLPKRITLPSGSVTEPSRLP